MSWWRLKVLRVITFSNKTLGCSVTYEWTRFRRNTTAIWIYESAHWRWNLQSQSNTVSSNRTKALQKVYKKWSAYCYAEFGGWFFFSFSYINQGTALTSESPQSRRIWRFQPFTHSLSIIARDFSLLSFFFGRSIQGNKCDNAFHLSDSFELRFESILTGLIYVKVPRLELWFVESGSFFKHKSTIQPNLLSYKFEKQEKMERMLFPNSDVDLLLTQYTLKFWVVPCAEKREKDERYTKKKEVSTSKSSEW